MKANRFVGMFLLALLLCGCKTPKPPGLGEPMAGLTPEQDAQFRQGKAVFERVFKPEDGLGPLFNANSCAECHERPAVGGVGDEVEIQATRFTAQGGCDELASEGGPVIQQHATPLLQAKGIEKEEIPRDATSQARRSTPPLFGFGLVDAIPEATILAHQLPGDARSNGIRGRANRTSEGRLGKFGRKAAIATLMDFNSGAFPQEMGVTTPLAPVEQTINGTNVPPDTDPAPDPEIKTEDMELVTAFVRFLAPPPPLVLTNCHDRHIARHGRDLFVKLHCAVCHVPTMQTGPSPIKALHCKTLALYSDLLLHDMGPELADICRGQAGPADFRTELLMGLRFRETFLHDGSAATVQEAIERHGGEAQYPRDQFKALNEADKQALLKFLGTI